MFFKDYFHCVGIILIAFVLGCANFGIISYISAENNIYQDEENFYNFIHGSSNYSASGMLLFTPLQVLQFSQFRFAMILFFYLAFPTFFYVIYGRKDLALLIILLPMLFELYCAYAQLLAMLSFVIGFHLYFKKFYLPAFIFLIITSVSHQFGGALVLLMIISIIIENYYPKIEEMFVIYTVALMAYAPTIISVLHVLELYYTRIVHFLIVIPMFIWTLPKTHKSKWVFFFSFLVLASFAFPFVYSGNAYIVWRVYAMFELLLLFVIAEEKISLI